MKTAGAKVTTTGPWKTARSIDWLTGSFIHDSDEFDWFGGLFLLLFICLFVYLFALLFFVGCLILFSFLHMWPIHMDHLIAGKVCTGLEMCGF